MRRLGPGGRACALFAAAALLGAAACDSGEDPQEADAAASPADAGVIEGDASTDAAPLHHLPLAVGNAWVYRVEHPKDGTFTKSNVVQRIEAIPFGARKGMQAFLVTTTKVGSSIKGDDRTDSWQAMDGPSVIRFAERSYKAGTTTTSDEDYWVPHKLRLDGTPALTLPGVMWEERYDSFKVTQSGYPLTAPARVQEVDQWSVESADATVTVDAGTFSNCLHLKKSGSSEDTGKTYWYCKGIGKVKELGRPGSGQNEYLKSYTIR